MSRSSYYTWLCILTCKSSSRYEPPFLLGTHTQKRNGWVPGIYACSYSRHCQSVFPRGSTATNRLRKKSTQYCNTLAYVKKKKKKTTMYLHTSNWAGVAFRAGSQRQRDSYWTPFCTFLNCEPQLELMIRRGKNQSWPRLGAELVPEGRGHPRKMDAQKITDEQVLIQEGERGEEPPGRAQSGQRPCPEWAERRPALWAHRTGGLDPRQNRLKWTQEDLPSTF